MARKSKSEQTYYKWRREYGSPVSELTLDKLILNEALSGKY
jgi:hypothetical protein